MGQTLAFYNAVKPLFANQHLSQKQIDGIEAIISGASTYQVSDKRMIAYVLATAFWESGETMQPISEYGKGEGHPYGGKIKQSGESYLLPDEIYYGRGHTQTTWFENYQMLQNQAYAISKNWRILEQPDLLLTMEPSVWAMYHCMWHGSYTGVGLSHYFNETTTDWINARRIINGTDQAVRIAGFAQTFFKALNS